LGKLLIESAKKEYGESCWLHSWINNTNAISFYKYLGFKDIGKMYFDLEGEQHENRVFAIKG